MKLNIKFFILGLILLMGLLLRTVSLDKVPVALSMDELAISYNSLSILKTGKDEFGFKFPLAFRSVGDYKPPLLVYMMMPAISIFGLSEFVVRITIALIGTLTIILVFLLVKELTKNEWVGFLTSFSLAISPWHIKFSRGSFEAILALFLVITGTYFFVKSINTNKKYLLISGIFFVLSMYAYHAERIFTPLLTIGLTVIYKSELFKRKREIALSLLFSFILLIPLILILLTPEGRIRASMTFITRDVELNRFLHKESQSDLVGVILDSNYIMTANFWAKRYLDYFDLKFLYTDGMEFSIPKSPNLGLLYLYELPFFLIGLYYLIFMAKELQPNTKKLIVYWFLVGPIAASFANNAQHPLRSLTMIPMPQLVGAVGFIYFLTTIKNLLLKRVLSSALVVISVISTLYFINIYFIHYQKTFSEYLMDGWKEASQYGLSHRQEYKEVVVDPRFGIQGPYTVGVPYLYFLFYGNIDPEIYQSDPRRQEDRYSSNFQNFTFRSIDWSGMENSDNGKVGTLFIGSPWVLPVREEEIVKRFYLINGKEILRAVTPK